MEVFVISIFTAKFRVEYIDIFMKENLRMVRSIHIEVTFLQIDHVGIMIFESFQFGIALPFSWSE